MSLLSAGGRRSACLLSAMGGVVVSAVLVSRPVEFRAISEFLQSAAERTAGLVIEGEAGIGKTTLWLAGQDDAPRTWISRCCPHASERRNRCWPTRRWPTYSATLTSRSWNGFRTLQRLAVDRVLLRASAEGPETDQRVVAAAFTAAVEHLAVGKPVLIAIDNVQWLDSSSQAVLAFAARRFRGRVGVLATERCEPDCGKASAWLELARPDGVKQIRVGPLSLGGLHAMISARLGRSFSRPTMVRIAEISGGNPFYALELARALHVGSGESSTSLCPAPWPS